MVPKNISRAEGCQLGVSGNQPFGLRAFANTGGSNEDDPRGLCQLLRGEAHFHSICVSLGV